MSRGVIIIAAGHSYYGNYAAQACRSIKAVDKSIKVALLLAEGAMAHVGSNPFDQTITIPKEYYTTNGLNDFLKAKTFIYELSPFDETIYVDADIIWLPQKKVSDLFEQLKEVDFTMSNRGKEPIGKALPGFIHWANPKDLIAEYKFKETDPLYNLGSEFIYFKKNKQVKKLFREAQKVYENPPSFAYKKFAYSLPDELPFEIAMIKIGIYPHAAPFIPFYWEQFERKSTPIYEIYKGFYAYSMGGNTNIGQMANIYNNLAQHYNSQFGINGCFPAKNKKEWLPERQTL